MKRLVVLVGVSIGLAACGTVKNPLQPQVVFDLENGYGVAQSAAVAYSSLPGCASGVPAPCANRGVVVELANADSKARVALKALEDFVRNPANYPGLNYSQLLSAAQNAIAVLKEIETQNGVK